MPLPVLLEDPWGLTPERRQRDCRFDCSARVEVWIDQDELQDDDIIAMLREGDPDPRSAGGTLEDALTTEQKIKRAKERAVDLAQEKVSELGKGLGIEVTADISLSDLNLDRISWFDLVTPADPEIDEDDEDHWDGPPADMEDQ